MHRIRTILLAGLMLGIGYLWGAGSFSLGTLRAQEAKPELPEMTAGKIRDAHRRLLDARDALEAEGRYEAITSGINSFLVFTGGGNAREDLESGRGVDPLTFAGLYAGQATPEIQALLSVNEHGQIVYNNEIVRMYSKSRLQKAFGNRLKIVETGM